MPKIYRVMLPDGNYPIVGEKKSMLGVRIGPPPNGDVELSQQGTVLPQSGGMSVTRHWSEMPYFLIPPRLRHLVQQPTKQRATSGNDAAKCWSMGEGEFIGSVLNDELLLRLDSPKHGLVEPRREIPISYFQQQLAATREDWVVDET